jgi:ATP-dependent protease ClpP protease subunit
MKASIVSLLLLFPLVSCNTLITLDDTNSVVIRGTITDDVADEFIKTITLSTPKYVYIQSNGGSVMAGNRMVTQMKNKNLTCIAERAYSMAFVILQACKERYILPTSTVMQHQTSMSGIRGDLYAITNYLEMIHSIDRYLTKLQAERIGITNDEFNALTSVEWWLFGDDIIENNVADEIVDVECTQELVKKETHVTVRGFFGDVEITYSGCPLIKEPTDIEYKNIASQQITEQLEDVVYPSEYNLPNIIKNWT